MQYNPLTALLIFLILSVLIYLLFRPSKGWFWMIKNNFKVNEKTVIEDVLKQLYHYENSGKDANINNLTDALKFNDNDIISAISVLPETRVKDSNRSKTIQLVQRILAAASVVLLLVFGIEQYVIVDKLIRLQVQTSSVSESNIRQHFIQYSKAYDPAVVFETIQHELASNFNNRKQLNFRMMLAVAQFKSVELDQYDLQRYAQLKSLIQNQTQEAYD